MRVATIASEGGGLHMHDHELALALTGANIGSHRDWEAQTLLAMVGSGWFFANSWYGSRPGIKHTLHIT